MRRVAVAAVGATLLIAPVVPAVAQPSSSATARATSVTKKVVTRTYVGSAVQADRWGEVQVTIRVRITTVGKKKTRRITAVTATYPAHTPRSQRINDQAIPVLRQEALAAQNANIDMVSGATDTSIAFIDSLQSAIVRSR